MSQHSQFAKLATRLIDTHGRAMALIRYVESGEAWNPVRVEEAVPVTAVQTKFRAFERKDSEMHDKKFLIDSSVEITTDMKLRDLSDNAVSDYSIVDTGLIQPGSTRILYKVQARL